MKILKLLITASLIFLVASPCFADKKISELTEATTVASGDFTVTIDSGNTATKKVKFSTILGDLLGGEIIKSSDGSLSAAQLGTGAIINNYGQAADTTISLAAAAKGMSFAVVLGTTVAKYYRIDPDAGDSIYLDGTTAGDGKYVGVSSAAVGDALSCFTFQTGASSYDWYCSAVSGSWVSE